MAHQKKRRTCRRVLQVLFLLACVLACSFCPATVAFCVATATTEHRTLPPSSHQTGRRSPRAWRRPPHAIPGHAARSRAGIPAEQPFPAETTPRRLLRFRGSARKNASSARPVRRKRHVRRPGMLPRLASGEAPGRTCDPFPAGEAAVVYPAPARHRCRLRRRPGCCCCGCGPAYRPRPEGSGYRKPPCSSACSAERHPYSLCPPVRAPEKGSASA